MNGKSAKQTIIVRDIIFAAIAILFCMVCLTVLVYYFHHNGGHAGGVLRLLLLIVLMALPSTVYFVFISSRKDSLFQEYISNLNRLGVLLPKSTNTSSQSNSENYLSSVGIVSYIKRFEAVYGPVAAGLSTGLIDALSTGSDRISNLGEATTEVRSTNESRFFSVSTVVPVFVASFLIGLCWLMFLPPWSNASGVGLPEFTETLSPNASVPLFAFLGAYFFSMQMLFRRYVTKDLKAQVYVSIAMRVALAIVAAWVLQYLFINGAFQNTVTFDKGSPVIADSKKSNEDTDVSTISSNQKSENSDKATAEGKPNDPVVYSVDVDASLSNDAINKSNISPETPKWWLLALAFVVGAFPPILWRIIRELLGGLSNWSNLLPSMESKLPISDLDGLTIWHRTRLEEEDIENTYNMASADVIDLFVQTKFPSDRIIDWVDQAILYSVIDLNSTHPDRRLELAGWGIRTASALVRTVEKATTETEELDTATNSMFKEFDMEHALSYVNSIRGFGNFALIEHWRSRVKI